MMPPLVVIGLYLVAFHLLGVWNGSFSDPDIVFTSKAQIWLVIAAMAGYAAHKAAYDNWVNSSAAY